MAYNVSAVYDVFLRPIRKNAKHFYGCKKNVADKNRTKAAGRLRFFRARAAVGGEAYTDLLCAVGPIAIIFFSI
jgi:hypothetical protein